MKAEQMPNPYNPPTIPPEPLASFELALATDAVCAVLAGNLEVDEGKRRDYQRLRMRLFHHEITAERAERQAGRVPA